MRGLTSHSDGRVTRLDSSPTPQPEHLPFTVDIVAFLKTSTAIESVVVGRLYLASILTGR